MAEKAPRGAASFRQRDLAAALKAMKAAGTAVERIEIGKGGSIVIIPSRENATAPAEANPWDEDE
jgi:hypothetical protein